MNIIYNTKKCTIKVTTKNMTNTMKSLKYTQQTAKPTNTKQHTNWQTTANKALLTKIQ